MRFFLVIAFVANILLGCSEQDRILPGKRETPDTSFGFMKEKQNAFAESNNINLPSMKSNSQWRLVSSTISKDFPNLMLGENITEIWSVSIGKGDSKKKRLVTDPMFYQETIYINLQVL